LYLCHKTPETMQDAEVRKRLIEFRIGIAGCGGLGSNCAVALSRVGIGRLILVDFDVVELSNLNRQYYFRDQIGLLKTEALTEKHPAH
jgi:sulfur carrier protein ThiS adenylyltransferase